MRRVARRRTDPLALPVVRIRRGSGRDRRGRGTRGPLALPGPLSPGAPSVSVDRREEFDSLVVSLVDRLAARWRSELHDVEFGTEDVPQLPDTWTDEPVPLGSLVRRTPQTPARIVVFRRPVELRATTRLERATLVNEVLVEHVAQLLGCEPDEVDP
ncbi:MAG: metallopeptidase family protein [Nocardioidaceae bacterium]|nr:metallopeptidase family protein [Nocardioidaceae bacterium]